MSEKGKDAIAGTVSLAVVVAILVGIIVGGFAGCGAIKDFNRGQARKNASNNVLITNINIRKAQQQARIVNAEIAITKAEAEKKYQESIGIRRAQDEVAKTLTPLYVQHEAIQAQERSPGAHTYIPVGAQGIPLVAPLNDQSKTVGGG